MLLRRRCEKRENGFDLTGKGAAAISIQQNVKNGLLTSGMTKGRAINDPKEYHGRQRRYLENETTWFLAETGHLATDFIKAQAQGLFSETPDEWTTIYARFADVAKPSAATTKNFDDYKQIVVVKPTIDYIRPGTKIVAMGNTWLVTNPANISGGDGQSIIQRCKAAWNHLDYYGNVLSEPLVIETERAMASAPDSQVSGQITKGYFNAVAQYNEHTKELRTNSRMILGTGAYSITGFSDFEMEFTGDYDSVRLIYFTLRYEEPNDAIDDMANHVAGGKSFSWDIEISGNTTMNIGDIEKLTAISTRNGEAVYPTKKHPITYLFESSNEGVATVDQSGNVTAVSEGQATITAYLFQNQDIKKEVTISVVETDAEPHVAFLDTVPEKIKVYESTTIEAAYFENGEDTGEPVYFILDGADQSAYSYSIAGNEIVIECWSGSVKPLTLTAQHGNYSVTAQIEMIGI